MGGKVCLRFKGKTLLDIVKKLKQKVIYGISKMVGPKQQDFWLRINIKREIFKNFVDECQFVKN